MFIFIELVNSVDTSDCVNAFRNNSLCLLIVVICFFCISVFWSLFCVSVFCTQCDVCGMEPIQGVRWHCQDCPQDSSVDFCSNCSDWWDAPPLSQELNRYMQLLRVDLHDDYLYVIMYSFVNHFSVVLKPWKLLFNICGHCSKWKAWLQYGNSLT